jgi:hypothetical protein
MRAALSMLLGLGLVFALTVSGLAKDKEEKEAKEVTLKGTITCAKCDLKEADKCATVIKAKYKGKDVVFYFDPTSGKKHHKAICTTPKEGSVTGAISEEDGKHMIKVSKVEFADKD